MQSANGSNSRSERLAIQEEVSALNNELNRIAETTSFGGNKLLNGKFGAQSFQIGADAGEAVMLTMSNMRSDDAQMGGKSYVATEGKADGWAVRSGKNDLVISYTDKQGEAKEVKVDAKVGNDLEELATYINGQNDDIKASVGEEGKLQVFASNQSVQNGDVSFSGSLAGELNLGAGVSKTVNDIDVSTVAGSQQAVSIIDGALKNVDSNRAGLGAFQNRFNHAISNLENINENVNASRSRIMDTDFAKETTQMTKSQILQNASTSVLAQAKQTPSAALSLLG